MLRIMHLERETSQKNGHSSRAGVDEAAFCNDDGTKRMTSRGGCE
jgi:hypothetical protein